MDFVTLYGESAKTALVFFWKSGWAFVLGYFVSGMIQAFAPKKELTKYMGDAEFKSVSLSTFFGGGFFLLFVCRFGCGPFPRQKKEPILLQLWLSCLLPQTMSLSWEY